MNDRSYAISVNATNLSGDPGRLIAWLDFDRNGVFDQNEAAARVVPANTTSGNFTITWSNIPADIQPGKSYLRLRFTTDAMNAGDPTGDKSDGEVEDYAITIVSAGVTVGGRVYIDANSNAANDSGESGIGNTVVVLRDTVSGACRSAKTNGGGDYQFADVSSGSYQLYQAHDESTPTPQNCDLSLMKNPTGYQSTTADTLNITVASAAIVDQDFGEVAGTHSAVTGNTGGALFLSRIINQKFYQEMLFFTRTGLPVKRMVR